MRRILLAGAALGAMTTAERAAGRYMRAPDDHPNDGGFADFANAGDVEVGKADIETSVEGANPDAEKPAKPKGGGSGKPPKEKAVEKPAEKDAADKAKGKEKPAADDEGEEGDDGDEGEGEEAEEGDDEKPAKRKTQTPSERIRDLSKRLRQSERLRLQDAERLDRLEKGLPAQKGGDKSADIGEAPDPTDQKKYPLGHLDDRYIEDKLEWLSTKKAAERADAVLQREQESEQARQAETAQAELLEKVDDLSSRGSEQYDDFQEAVVDAGMRGDWRLDQPTFEACAEADHGVQILYELSQDKAEAKRVASLSPYAQLRYVVDRDAKIAAESKPRTKPGASEPPQTKTSGSNSRARINPATDDLKDFEKAWQADAKGK